MISIWHQFISVNNNQIIMTYYTLTPHDNTSLFRRDNELMPEGYTTIKLWVLIYGLRQANLVLIAYASSEGSGEPAHSAQSRQNLRCSLIQAVSQKEPSDRKPDPWPFWMAGHAQLKFVMTECSKTQIRLTGLICFVVLNEQKLRWAPNY